MRRTLGSRAGAAASSRGWRGRAARLALLGAALVIAVPAAATTVVRMRARDGVDLARTGSLVNDVLIATSCREARVRLVTENAGDFATLQRHLRGFRFVAADEALT